jgi:spore coat polysaccharide biosynthesis protein SpsF
MKIGIITQARMTSTRLPGKILLEEGGISFLKYHVERLRQTGLPLFVATTTNDTDEPIVNFCIQNDLPYYRGDEDNVLSRFYFCAKENNLDVVIRVTSDCPFVDPSLILEGVDLYNQSQDSNAYVSNCLVRTFPRGIDFEIFSFSALEDAYLHASLSGDLEHVTPYIHQNRSGVVVVKHIVQKEDKSQFRITLDTPEDLQLISTLIRDYNAHYLSHTAIVNILESQPDLVAINAHVEQKKI